MMFLTVLAVAFAQPTLPAPAVAPTLPAPAVAPPGPVPSTVAIVQSKEVVKEGTLIKAQVKLLKPGTYYVVGGYVVDYDAKFQFLQGKKSGTKYFVVRKVVSEKPDAVVVDLEFPIKAVPPLIKPVARVFVYSSLDHIPVLAP